VKWENTNNEAVLNQARAAIMESWREICALNKDHPDAAELFNPEKLPGFTTPSPVAARCHSKPSV
jgi:putative DNA methylase